MVIFHSYVKLPEGINSVVQGQRAQGSKGSWFVWECWDSTYGSLLESRPCIYLSRPRGWISLGMGNARPKGQVHFGPMPISIPTANLSGDDIGVKSPWPAGSSDEKLWMWIKLAYPQIERAKRLKRYRLKTKHDSCRLWKNSTHSRFENNPASQLPDQSHHAAATATWDAVPDLQNATPFHMLIGFPIIFGL